MEFDPADTETLLWLSYLLMVHAGQSEKSMMIAERWSVIDPMQPMTRMVKVFHYWFSGKTEKASTELELWLKAEGYSMLGMIKESLFWLERVIEKGIFNYPLLNEKDPLLSNIRNEQRFTKLMRDVKIRWEAFRI